MRLAKGDKVLPPVHPNVGIRAAYRAALERLIEEMATSYLHWLRAQYRKNPPRLAMDALPARDLERQLSQLGKQWAARFDEQAPKLAQWFAKKASKRSAASLRKILKDAGISVEFQQTRTMRDAFAATVAENVGLIKSIPARYHDEVQGLVMRSVSTGRDLAQLTDDLEERYGITRKRAAFIALDQNNKATAVMTRVRQQDNAITKAIWLHSHAGKKPRKTHLANTGKVYDPAKGWFDPDPRVKRFIWPGELPRCRCVSRSIVKGFS
jgi:uncharacterized protein with gpF-like domain